MKVGKSVAQRQKEGIVFAFILSPIVIWVGLMLGPLLRKGLGYTFYNFGKVRPFPVNIALWNWKYALFFLLFYAVVVAVVVSSMKEYDLETPDGSAKFTEPARLTRKFSDKTTYPIIAEDSQLLLMATSSAEAMKAQKETGKKFSLVALNAIKKEKADRTIIPGQIYYNNKNKILSQNVLMGLDGRKTRRNLNTCVVGGSGSGKTRFFVKPNILQGNTSYIILDPKGELLRDTGWALKQMGYKVKVLNLVNMQESDCYNPFKYLRDDQDIQLLVGNLFKATGNNENNSSQDPFWDNAAKALLTALVSYCHYFLPEEEQNFGTVGDLLRLGQIKNEDAGYKSDLDLIFDEIRAEIPDQDPRWICLKFYDDYHSGAAKTLQSIQVTLAARLNKFNVKDLQRLTSTDMLDLDMIGQEKTALYCIIPVSNDDFNFVVSILYTQLFQRLFYVADIINKGTEYEGRLRQHVHFVLDECANVPLPEGFPRIVSIIRSYEISVTIILQNLAQLKKLFEKDWEGILGNCDEFVYLGGEEHETHKYLSEKLGKKTIHTKNFSRSKGQNGSFTDQDNTKARELALPDEIRVMNEEQDRCLVFVRDQYPTIDAKYDLMKHPNIKLCSDGGAPRYLHNSLEIPPEYRLSEDMINRLLDESMADEDDGYDLQNYTNTEIGDLFINPEDQQLSMTASAVADK